MLLQFIKIIFLLFYFCNIVAYAQNSIKLTSKESEFLKQNKTIVLGIDESMKPFVIEQNGKLRGFEVDVLNRINELTGANFVLKLGSLEQLRKEAIDNEIHGLASYTPIEEEKSYFDFSNSYLQMQKLVLVAMDNPKNIQSLDDLKGKTLAVQKSNLYDNKLAQNFDVKVNEYRNIEDVMISVISNKSDAMFSNGSVFYISNELGLAKMKPVRRLPDLTLHRYALNKNNALAVSIINKALEAIGNDELLILKNKWFSSNLAAVLPDDKKMISLSFEEKEYLIRRPVLKMCIESNLHPAYNKYINANNDFMTLIEQLLKKDVERVYTDSINQSFDYLQENRCDIVSVALKTESTQDRARFTKPYLEIPIALATDKETNAIIDINYIEKLNIAIVKNRGISSNILKNYENLNVYEVDNLTKAFKALSSGKVDAVAGALGVLDTYIKHHSSDFKINGTFNEKLYLHLAVKNDDSMLHSILNSAIDAISPSVKNEIMNRWFSIQPRVQKIDYTLLFQVVIPLFLVALFYIFRTYELKKVNNKIKTELDKLRKKDNLVFEQNKMATIANLISTISHQWRQPLSELMMSQNILISKIKNDDMQPLEFADELSEQQKIVLFMSNTIESFRNFYSNKKSAEKIEEFYLYEAYEDIEFLIADSLNLHSIEVEKQIDRSIKIDGNKNILSQVFLSIIYNSIYFLHSRKVTQPKICIKIYKEERNNCIEIVDNALGAPSQKLPYIFDFNYSYRDSKQNSTGIGLSIAKMIINEKFNGKIEATNVKNGLKVTIVL